MFRCVSLVQSTTMQQIQYSKVVNREFRIHRVEFALILGNIVDETEKPEKVLIKSTTRKLNCSI